MTGYAAAKGYFSSKAQDTYISIQCIEIKKGQKQNSFYILVVVDESKIMPSNFEVALCNGTCET